MLQEIALRTLLAGIVHAGSTVPAAAAPEAPPAPNAAAPDATPLELRCADAVLMALSSSPELAVERLRPEVARTLEGGQRAVFDPVLSLEDAGWQRSKGEKLRGEGIVETFETDSPVGRLALEGHLPTGTDLAIEASTDVADESLDRQLVQSRVGFTLSQALLRGLGPRANLARVRAARIDAQISDFELRGFTESFVALVERTCWDYALHRRQVEILDDSIAMAERQLHETEARVEAGTSAKMDLAAARSEVSLRNQERIDSRSEAETTRLHLLRLLSPGGPDAWSREIRLREDLVAPDASLAPVTDEVALAMRTRPELNQAKLLAERGDLEVVRTRNGLLPRMDLFFTLGRSGYSDSFRSSWSSLDGTYHDVFAGLRFELPIRRSASRAQHERAVLEKAQADKGVENLRQLIEVDVRSARIELERALGQIAASARTRQLDEEKLAAETEKFRIDRASSFQVARAQRDLTRSRLAEVAALADAQKALVELYRLDGTLLTRRGIAAPGQPHGGRESVE